MNAVPSGVPTARTRPLRVLWLIKGLGAGGAERLLVLHARALDPKRSTPTVAYLLSEKSDLVPALADAGVPAQCLGARSGTDLRWVPRLRRLLQRGEFDVVHIHSPLAAIGCRLVIASLPRSQRPAIVVTEHNVWASHTRTTRCADLATFRRNEVHIAVSAAVRASLPSSVRKRTRVLHHGIDVEAVRRAGKARDEMRAELGIADDDLVVGTVANLRRTKGYPDLMLAARRVLDEVPQARFLAAGRGPMEAELRALHDELGLGPRFQLLGHRPDALEVMSTFDVFCLPSRHEGLPISLMEALALGLPIVATRAGGVEELLTDGREATLLPPAAPDLLADELIAVLRDDRRRAAMARASFTRGDSIGVEQTVDAIEAVYLEVAST